MARVCAWGTFEVSVKGGATLGASISSMLSLGSLSSKIVGP